MGVKHYNEFAKKMNKPLFEHLLPPPKNPDFKVTIQMFEGYLISDEMKKKDGKNYKPDVLAGYFSKFWNALLDQRAFQNFHEPKWSKFIYHNILKLTKERQIAQGGDVKSGESAEIEAIHDPQMTGINLQILGVATQKKAAAAWADV